jgi:hypothetical protein
MQSRDFLRSFTFIPFGFIQRFQSFGVLDASATGRITKGKMKTLKITAAVAALAIAMAGQQAAFADSAAPVYVDAASTNETIQVLATSGDKFGSYVLPGTPDGLGLYKSGTGYKMLLNHEFTSNQSAFARANGAITGGSTISELTYDANMKLVSATDAIKNVVWYDYLTATYGKTPVAPTGAAAKNSYGDPFHTTAVQRFCSASLAAAGSFAYTTGSGKKAKTIGYTKPVFLTGEEDGAESRSFALNAEGEMVQLPRLGLADTETFNVAPGNTLQTVLIGNEDGSVNTSELRLYVGAKTSTGAWYERAGLTNGQLYYAKVRDILNDTAFRSTVGKGKPTAVSFKSIDTSVNGAEQAKQGVATATGFSRIEDGQFDPLHPNDYYFVTTSSNGAAAATTLDPALPKVTKRDGGGLWRLRFKDIKDPLAGATVELLLDGSEPAFLNMPDNLTIDKSGNIILQEDPGNNVTLSRVFAYRIKDAKLAQIAGFNAALFSDGSAKKITVDEESSGVTDVTDLLRKNKSDKNSYYVFVAQVHAPVATARPDLTDAASIASAVEGGQIYLLTVPSWSKIYG